MLLGGNDMHHANASEIAEAALAALRGVMRPPNARWLARDYQAWAQELLNYIDAGRAVPFAWLEEWREREPGR